MKKLIVTMVALLVAATAVRADVLASWDNNALAAGATTAPVNTTLGNVSSSDLTYSGFTLGDWPNSLTVRGIYDTTLAGAISAGRYYSVTLTPDSGFGLDLNNVGFEGTYAANTVASSVDVTLMSSLTGFTATDGLDSVSLAIGAGTTSLHYFDQVFDVSGESALDNVTGAVEFRLYIHNTGANVMQRFGIGHSFYTGANAGTQDLEFNGTVSAIPEPATLGLFVFVSGGMLWIRRKFMI